MKVISEDTVDILSNFIYPNQHWQFCSVAGPLTLKAITTVITATTFPQSSAVCGEKYSQLISGHSSGNII
jgi:hypothetical protein